MEEATLHGFQRWTVSFMARLQLELVRCLAGQILEVWLPVVFIHGPLKHCTRSESTFADASSAASSGVKGPDPLSYRVLESELWPHPRK